MRSTTRGETFPVHTPAASQIFTTVLSHGPLTRLEAARRAGLSPAAVTKAVGGRGGGGVTGGAGAEWGRPRARGAPAALGGGGRGGAHHLGDRAGEETERLALLHV
ncbi:hypothetical protein ACFV23_44930, partial [Streptomyces sp. NPDC059627]